MIDQFKKVLVWSTGAFVINLLVGAGQLFTVLFCLVGWGWSIWWGVIMVKISREYYILHQICILDLTCKSFSDAINLDTVLSLCM